MKTFAKIKDPFILGFALFAMFFGAGNLIFPPLLGQMTGDQWPLAFAGFLLMDAVLACVGVFAVTTTGGPMDSLQAALGCKGGNLLNAAAITCLCVLFAMPRTAATTYEISAVPYLGEADATSLLIFSLVFFGIVFLLALRESRIVDIVGRFFTPTLVAGTLLLIVVGVIAPIGPIEPPRIANVIEEGMRSGYQTMDVLGVVAFTIILLNSQIVQARPTRKEKRGLIIQGSVVAVTLLGVIYGGLTYVGATSSSLGQNLTQVQLLVAITQQLLGSTGLVILGFVVLIACITTAIALVGSAAAFFHQLIGGRIPYKVLVGADCIIGVLICNLGLDNIIALSGPVLDVVYPAFMTAVVMLLFHKYIPARSVYQGGVLGAFFASLIQEVCQLSFTGAASLSWLPLSSFGMAWLPFTLLGAGIGWLVFRLRSTSDVPHMDTCE